MHQTVPPVSNGSAMALRRWRDRLARRYPGKRGTSVGSDEHSESAESRPEPNPASPPDARRLDLLA